MYLDLESYQSHRNPGGVLGVKLTVALFLRWERLLLDPPRGEETQPSYGYAKPERSLNGTRIGTSYDVSRSGLKLVQVA